MKKRIVVVLACLLAAGVSASECIQVISRGMGKDAASATKDALVQAVQQVVGAMVDSETLMKNDAILKEQVLTFSDGFVSKYEVLKAPAPNKYGLYETTIKAQVEQKKLRGKLAEARILKIEVKDAQNIWAKLETEQLRKENAETMLLKIFSMLDPKDFLIPTLVDPQKRMGKDAKLNVIREKGKMFIAMGVLVSFNHQKYVREIQPHLLHAMDKLCLDRAELPLAPTNESSNGLKIRFETEEGVKDVRFGSIYHRKNVAKATDKRSAYVFVNRSKSSNPRSQAFVAYRFPRWDGSLQRKIRDIVRRNVFVVFTVKNAAGEVIRQKDVQISGSFGKTALCWESYGMRLNISPEFVVGTGYVSPVQANGFTCEITPDELKDIKSIELTIKEEKK